MHSGVYGGSVHEANTDLMHVMASLVKPSGEISVPGIADQVRGRRQRPFLGLSPLTCSLPLSSAARVGQVDPVAPEEAATYDSIDFDPAGLAEDVGLPAGGKLLHDNKKDLLMHRWRFPSLSLHGIEGAWSGAGAKTVIPARVVGKFSMRIVPSQTPDHVEKCVRDHVAAKFAELGTCVVPAAAARAPSLALPTCSRSLARSTARSRGAVVRSPNKWKLTMGHGAEAWKADVNGPSYAAARRATQLVHGVEPDLTREGGSIPITLTFEKATGKSVILIPIGASDDGARVEGGAEEGGRGAARSSPAAGPAPPGAHSQNEKLDRSNYLNGIKLLGAYLFEVAKDA